MFIISHQTTVMRSNRYKQGEHKYKTHRELYKLKQATRDKKIIIQSVGVRCRTGKWNYAFFC